MKESKVDVILHPVRMRIIQYLINQKLTAQELKELLSDIPQATLYRHIKKLTEAELIHIVDEIPNRGTIEKVYSINDPKKSTIGPEEISQMTKDEQMSLFFKFIANLLGDFERYLSQEEVNFEKDGVAFRQTSMYLNDTEFKDFVNELSAVYAKFVNNKPQKGRTRRTVATIIIPEKESRGNEKNE